MPRLALPQNYITASGTQIADFENLGDYDVGGTVVENTDEYVEGSKSFKLSAPAGGVTWVGKTITAQRISGHFRFWVYQHSSSLWQLRIEISSTTDYSKRFRALKNGDRFYPQGIWTQVVFTKKDFSVSFGDESWDNDMIRIRVAIASHGDTASAASIDDLRYEVEGIPSVIFGFDDSYENDLGGADGTAYEYMQARGIQGTCYTVADVLGEGGKQTLAGLQTLYAQGWAIASHSYTSTEHGNWVNGIITTQAEYEAVLQNIINYLINNNMPRCAYYFAYPGGVYNSETDLALTEKSILVGRTATNNSQAVPEDMKKITSSPVGGITTLATAKGWIDDAIRYGTSAHINFHHFVESSPTANEWEISKFKALIDYAVARKIKTQTIDEWYEGLENPRYRSLSLDRVEV